MSDNTHILIVDDHQILIDGIVELLSKEDHLQIVDTTSDPMVALEIVDRQDIDVIICDLNMPEMHGKELIPLLKKANEKVKVIVLSMHEEKHVIKEALQAGADAYVLKRSTHSELLEAVTKVMENTTFVSQSLTQMLVDEFKNPSAVDALSEREIEIIRLIAQELTNKQIASTLFISEKTVETHKSNIFKKTNSVSAVGIARFAYEHNLL